MAEPEICVRSIPRNAAVLVMTHSHELDYELCHALLKKKRTGIRWINRQPQQGCPISSPTSKGWGISRKQRTA